MARGKKHTAEQIVNLLRQVEVGVANGKTLPQACKEAEIVEQTYYRWRKDVKLLASETYPLAETTGAYRVAMNREVVAIMLTSNA